MRDEGKGKLSVLIWLACHEDKRDEVTTISKDTSRGLLGCDTVWYLHSEDEASWSTQTLVFYHIITWHHNPKDDVKLCYHENFTYCINKDHPYRYVHAVNYSSKGGSWVCLTITFFYHILVSCVSFLFSFLPVVYWTHVTSSLFWLCSNYIRLWWAKCIV
jgi:hypothetical protein